MLSQIPRIFRIPASLRSHLRSWKSAKGFLPSCGHGPTSPTTRMTTMHRWGTSGMGMNGVEGDAARRMEDTQQIQLLTQYPVSKKKQGFGCGHFHFHTPRKKNTRDIFFGRSFVVISSHFFRRWDDEIGGHGWAMLLLHHRVEGVGVMSWGKLKPLVVMICPLLFGKNTSRYEFQNPWKLESQHKRETTTLYSNNNIGHIFWTKSCYIFALWKKAPKKMTIGGSNSNIL